MHSSVFLFLNIGTPELIIILFAALMLFGGEKLPELARGLGKGLRDFKDASDGVKREIHNQILNYDEKAQEPEQHHITEATATTETDTTLAEAETTVAPQAEPTEKKEY